MGFFEGGDGDDLITGGDGADTLRGYRGSDTLEGGFGGDTLIGGRGDDYIDGGEGDDYIRIDRGNDTIDGGLGFDTLDYSWWVIDDPDGLNINLNAGFVLDFNEGEDFISGIEHVIGPDGSDTIIGSSEDEWLEGGVEMISFQAVAEPIRSKAAAARTPSALVLHRLSSSQISTPQKKMT